MILLVDIGNTQFKWALLTFPAWTEGTNSTLEFKGSARHFSQQFDVLLSQHWQELQVPSAVLVANVAGDKIQKEIEMWIEKYWQCPVKFLISQPAALGVVNAYEEPCKLGIDRWLGILAAWQDYSGPLCVIGCGTAVTVDVVTREGQHLGGFIAPDMELMRLALSEHTYGGIFIGDYTERGIAALGKSTHDAIANGTLSMAIAFINKVLNDVPEYVGAHFHCIITGGNANAFLPYLTHPYNYRPYLVLEGLQLMAK